MNRKKIRFTEGDFRILSDKSITDESKISHIRNKVPIDANIAREILKAKPIKSEDFLKIPILLRTYPKISEVLIQSPSNYSPYTDYPDIEQITTTHLKGGIFAELKSLDDSTRQFSLRDLNGDLISFKVVGNDEIDLTTLTFLEVRTSFLWKLTNHQKKLLHSRLHNIDTNFLIDLFKNSPKNIDYEANLVRKSAAILFRLQSFTASGYSRSMYSQGFDVLSENPTGGIDVIGDPSDLDEVDTDQDKECTEGNGCGPEFSEALADAVPEFSFADCCLAHDIAYCKGCSECDRLKADNEFLDCMLNSDSGATSATISFIFYLSVRAIGVMAANKCPDRPGGIGKLSMLGAIVGGLLTGALALAGLGATIVTAGFAAVLAGLIVLAISSLACSICWAVDSELREVIDDYQEYQEYWRQLIRRRRRKCKRKRSWLRKLICKIKNLPYLFVWILIEIIVTITVILIQIIRTIICGGINHS